MYLLYENILKFPSLAKDLCVKRYSIWVIEEYNLSLENNQ